MTYHLAIGIGASGGRHILGHRENGRLVCEEVYRFSSRLVRVNGHDCWDMDTLESHLLEELKACQKAFESCVS
ncbi:MAG TPA: hypothetical protein H9674_08030 [Firmicutes bacterium]|nr:hypothetical protein [Bacillota bacterium]